MKARGCLKAEVIARAMISLLAIAGCGHPHQPPLAVQTQQVEPAVMRELSALPSSYVYYISVDFSRVVIKSHASDALVTQGPKVLPVLVAEMKKPSITFDTFIREYSVCELIVENEDPPGTVFWSGGSEDDGSSDHPHFEPPLTIDGEDAFRKAVIESIESKIKSGG